MIVRNAPAPNPFALAHGHVKGTVQEVDAAIAALAYELAHAEVRGTTIEHLVRSAAFRNATPRRPPSDIEGLIFTEMLRADRDLRSEAAARKAAAARRGLVDEAPTERDRVYVALKALTLASFHTFLFDRDTGELDATWAETGELVHLPVSGEAKDLQKALTHVFGSVVVFAARAHEKAKKADLVAVLQEIASGAPRREKSSEDFEPIQLVEAIFSHRVVRLTTDDKGNERQAGFLRVRDLKGIHAADGVAIWEDRRARRTFLVIHTASLAGRLQNPQFRFKRASQLRDLFLRAPGALPDYYSPAECKKQFGTNRTYALDIEAFETAATNSRKVDTSGGDEENTATVATSATGDAEMPSQQSFSVVYETTPSATGPLPTQPSEPGAESVGSVSMFETLPTNMREESGGYVRPVALVAEEAPF